MATLFHDATARQIIDSVRRLQSQYANITASLAMQGLRRHEVRDARASWNVASFQFDGTGALTPSSGTYTPMYCGNMIGAADAPFELTTAAPAGEIRVLRDTSVIISGYIEPSCAYSRANWSQITATMQSEYLDSGSWSNIGLGSSLKLAWPDVATLSSSGGFYGTTLWFHIPTGLSAGMDLRGSLGLSYSGSAIQISAGGYLDIAYDI